MVIPEVHGRLGLGDVELCAIAEELGRAVRDRNLASTLVFFGRLCLRGWFAGSRQSGCRKLPRRI